MRLLRLAAPLLGAFLAAAPLAAQKSTPRPPTRGAPVTPAPAAPVAAPAPPAFGYLQGVAYDSLHGDPLAGALVLVDGANRIGISDSLGRFLVDSIKPGDYRVTVDHPLLDTLGISLVTQSMSFTAGMVTRTTIAIPAPEYLVALFCTPARRALGPGALVGRVREPDSDASAIGARVSFVFYDPDPPGLPTGFRTKKQPRVREATVGEDGTYRLCGLPATFEGKLQAQRKDGGATAEVTIAQSEAVLALRSMSVAALPTLATGVGAAIPVQKGAARVFGKVVNANGAPVPNARVGLMGASAATLTRANGDFVLDSLPSGTQALVIRQLGYRPIEYPVELSARKPARVTVKLGVFVPELSPVEVVSQRDIGLQKVGFTDRKRNSAGGSFLDSEQIERRKASMFTDLLRTTPGLRVNTQNGQATVTASRTTAGNGCVTFWVDGAQWQSFQPGDLDSFVRPEEVAAVEVYNGGSIPAQFTTIGQNCSAVVVWTKTRVQSKR